MPRMLGQGVQDPELGEGQVQRLLLPAGVQAVQVQQQLTALQAVILLAGLVQRIQTPEQGGDTSRQMGQADVLGKVIIGPQAQAGDGVEFAVAGGQKQDRQVRCPLSQFPAQIKAAFNFILQTNVDDRHVR